MTSQMDLHPVVETDSEIVERAREMSEMVNEMYLFTKYVLDTMISCARFADLVLRFLFVFSLKGGFLFAKARGTSGGSKGQEGPVADLSGGRE